MKLILIIPESDVSSAQSSITHYYVTVGSLVHNRQFGTMDVKRAFRNCVGSIPGLGG